jgi:hypothetical protein
MPSNGASPERKTSFRRRARAVRFGNERLEDRVTPAAIDVAAIATAPYGVQHWGAASNDGSGWKATDVGDVNGDGYDDYVIGAPSITTTANVPQLGTNAGIAYLIFGSRQVNQAAIFDFLNLTAQQRIGDLAQLNNAAQTNPTNGQAGFNFAGVRLTASQSPNGQLGASVIGVGDLNNDGLADFIVGAPNATNQAGTAAGFGRAYLIYGTANLVALSNSNTALNLDSAPANVRVQTFVTSQAGSQLGFSATGVGNFLRDGTNDIALGAPGATPGGLAGSGAVYAISFRTLNSLGTTPIDVTRIGQTGGISGVVFAGERAAARAGFSVASAGDVNNDNGGVPDDLLIGAPDSDTQPGDAYLIYGATGLQAAQQPSGTALSINLNRIGAGGTSGIAGADFQGTSNGDRVGFAVSTAGDFNGDGISDILVGAPTRNAGAGRATLIYGRSGTSQINGRFPIDSLNTLTPAIRASYFDGPSAGAFAGYSLTATGLINNDNLNEIAVGTPGLNNNSGAVFLIPGNPSLPTGAFTLDTNTAQNAPLFALVITDSQPSAVPNFFGGSLGARVFPLLTNSTAPRYIDSDTLGDFLVGAPNFSPTSPLTRSLAGTGFVLEGAFLRNLLPVPPNTTITVPIGVGSVPPGPFVIDPANPAALQIWVGSNTSVQPPFAPLTMLSNPTTVTVNGVTFQATVAPDGDFNNDGITDAILTISPRSALNLTPGTTVTFTVAGQTNEAVPRLWSGSTQVQITNVTPTPPVLPAASAATPIVVQNIPPFGEALVPAVPTMSKLNYRPLPVAVAMQQFRLTPAYAERLGVFFGRSTNKRQLGTRFKHAPDHANTLGYGVFSRGKYKVGQVRFAPVKHSGNVVPINFNG